MKFSEVLKEYIRFKQSRNREGKISRDEIKALREEYLNGNLEENLENFDENFEEKNSIRERRHERINEIRERIAERKKEAIRARIKEKLEERKLDERREAIRARIKEKIAERKKEAIREKIREEIAENKRLNSKRNRAKFIEEEVDAATGMGMDPNQDQNQAVDPNAQAQPAAGQFDPASVASQVEQIKSALESLASMLGVQENPMDANPDANIPPESDINMDGMDNTDPNAQAAPAPMPESMKRRVVRTVNYIRESLKNKRIYEAFKMKYPLALGSLFDLIDKTPRTVNKNDNPSMLSNIPSVKTLVKGTDTSKDVVRWPNEKITNAGTVRESITEKMISDHIQKLDENWDFAKILKSGVIS